jgi:hypothetical protein
VEDAVRSIGQTFAAVGSLDPCLTPAGKHDFRLRHQFNAYAKVDPPPKHDKPIPLPILQHVMRLANHTTNDALLAIADMICIAFFFLLRPGEYTVAPSENTPFCLTDVKLKIGSQPIDLFTAPEATILSATFATLEFTTQKNAVRGEVIGHGKSGSSTFWSVKSLARRVLHPNHYGAPPETPLAPFFAGSRFKPIKPSNISDNLRTAVSVLGTTYGFTRSDISARSLRVSGAMALLCGSVDTNIICLIRCWPSDEMLRYLHVQAEPVMRCHSTLMLSGGEYTLHPNCEVPMF